MQTSCGVNAIGRLLRDLPIVAPLSNLPPAQRDRPTATAQSRRQRSRYQRIDNHMPTWQAKEQKEHRTRNDDSMNTAL